MAKTSRKPSKAKTGRSGKKPQKEGKGVKSFIKDHYHWVTVALCCGLSGTVLGVSSNSMGVFYLPVARELGVGVGDVALYLTIMSATFGLLAPVVVRHMKKIPLRLMLGAATVMIALCYVLLANATAIWQFYAIALLLGVSHAYNGLIVGNVVLGNWFEKKLGTATGLFMGIAGIIGAVLSPIFASLIASIGWRPVYLIAGGLIVLFMLPAVLFMRATPEEMGLKKYGADEAEGKKKSGFSLELTEEQKYPQKSSAAVWLLLLSGLTAFAAVMCQHFSAFAESVGYTASFGAMMISVGMIGNIVTKVAGGVLSDALGSVRATAAFLIAAIAGCLAMAWMPGLIPVLFVSAFLISSYFSTSGVTNLSMIKERFKAADYARICAVMSIFRSIGAAVAYSVIGYSYDFFGSYNPALYFCAALGAVSLIGVMRIAQGQRRA